MYIIDLETRRDAITTNKDEYIYFKHWCPTHEFCSNKFSSLRYLIMDTDYYHHAFGCLTPTISTIRYFKLSEVYSIIWLMHLFRYSPQLKGLHIEMISAVLDEDDFHNRYPTKKPIIFPCALTMHILVIKNCYYEPISIEYILRACPYLKQFHINSTLEFSYYEEQIRVQLFDPMIWQSMINQWGQNLIDLKVTLQGDQTFVDEDRSNEFWRSRSWQVKTSSSPPHFIIQTQKQN